MTHTLINKVALFGYTGRMGKEVISELSNSSQLTIGALIGRDELKHPNAVLERLSQCDAIIDFTNTSAQNQIYQVLTLIDTPIPMITGVTGLNDECQAQVETYATRAPVLQSANFSIGISLLKRLSVLAAQALGEDFDAEIFELHHRHKLDAPSGTATLLAEAVMEGKQQNTQKNVRMGISLPYPRDPHYVHLSAARGGGVFGDHSVFFLGDHERLELKHAALNRSVFAAGALKATQWCLKQPPGLYQMDHLWEL
jgi:4-hydroxy-tetrahydrodipicolinate reductase